MSQKMTKKIYKWWYLYTRKPFPTRCGYILLAKIEPQKHDQQEIGY